MISENIEAEIAEYTRRMSYKLEPDSMIGVSYDSKEYRKYLKDELELCRMQRADDYRKQHEYQNRVRENRTRMKKETLLRLS